MNRRAFLGAVAGAAVVKAVPMDVAEKADIGYTTTTRLTFGPIETVEQWAPIKPFPFSHAHLPTPMVRTLPAGPQ